MDRTASFGYWVRRQRKALDLTQQVLAERVGCSLAAIKKIESDERRPSRQIAERLADLLGVPTAQRKMFVEVARGLRPGDELFLAPESIGLRHPTGTVTFLYTDIEGSTQLWEHHPKAMAVVHARHDRILREAIESNHGYVFQVVGDSFHAAFHTVADAVGAAVKSQLDLHAQSWGEAPIRVRMGLHTGKAELQQDESYGGYVTLSHAQRVMSVGHGGQVLLSFNSQQLVQDELPGGIELHDLGQRQLKDLRHPEHIFQLVMPGLPADFPPLNIPKSFPHNLPTQLTSFIGRERDRTEVRQLLSRARMLTLTGPGGIGKTRLALQVAEELLPSFADGVWLAELASLTDASLIPQTLASVFDLRELPGVPIIHTVSDYLRAKRSLLILDNCEHLIQACAELSDQLLRSCPQLKIIASSRELLGIAGETTYRVPPLSSPDHPQVTREEAIGFESVRLFVERACAANPRLHLTSENASAVVQICRRLDGIPLALELAAARGAVYSPQQIAARLDDRFKLLTGGSRTALERHQTLRSLIDWSYDLLSDAEQALLRHLSVFAGGCTLEAAETVCSDLDVFNLLTQLVNKSMVMVDEQADGMRYHLLETVRQYSRDRLLEAGESEHARNQHLEFFLNLAERAERNLDGPQELEWMMRLETDYYNLRAALEWSLENDLDDALRLGGALSVFWVRHGLGAEGREWLTKVLARTRSLFEEKRKPTKRRISIRAKALLGLGLLTFDLGDPLSARTAFEDCATLSRQVGDERTLSWATSYMAMNRAFGGDPAGAYSPALESLGLARRSGDKLSLAMALYNMAAVTAMAGHDLESSRVYAEEGIRLLNEVGSRWYSAMALFGIGIFAQSQGHYAEAQSRFESCVPLFAELGDRHRICMLHSEFAHLERRQGHFAQAQRLYRETIREWQELGHRAAIAHQLECFASIAKAQEQTRRAIMLFGAAEALREMIKISRRPIENLEYERDVNDLRANLDESVFASAWAEGQAMSMEQAIALALETQSEAPLPPSESAMKG